MKSTRHWHDTHGRLRRGAARGPRRIALALLLTLAPALAAAQPAPGAAEARLTLAAEGQVEAVPDMATITLGVAREAGSAAEASAAMAEAAEALLEALAAAGIAERDIRTSALSLAPTRAPRDSDGNPGEITGYEAETTVTIRVRALDRLGAVLDTAIGSGANRMQGLALGLSDPQPLMDEARRRAVAEAARRAALYAEAAGLALGPLLALDETGGAEPRPFAARADMAMAQSAPVPVAAGEITLTARVTVTYALGP
jgi:uncharacterized protein YggE